MNPRTRLSRTAGILPAPRPALRVTHYGLSCLLLALLFSVTPAQSAVQSLYKMSEHDAAVAKANAAASTNDLASAVATLETAIANATPENYPAVASAATNAVQNLGDVGGIVIGDTNNTDMVINAETLTIEAALNAAQGFSANTITEDGSLLSVKYASSADIANLQTQLDEKAGVMTNVYTVTAPASPLRTFDPTLEFHYGQPTFLFLDGATVAPSVEDCSQMYGFKFTSAATQKAVFMVPDKTDFVVFDLYFRQSTASATSGAKLVFSCRSSPESSGAAYTFTMETTNAVSTMGWLHVTNNVISNPIHDYPQKQIQVTTTSLEAPLTTQNDVWLMGVRWFAEDDTASTLGTFLLDAGAVTNAP